MANKLFWKRTVLNFNYIRLQDTIGTWDLLPDESFVLTTICGSVVKSRQFLGRYMFVEMLETRTNRSVEVDS